MLLASILTKFWKVMLNVSYRPDEMQQRKGSELTLPVSKEVYKVAFALIEKALGPELMQP